MTALVDIVSPLTAWYRQNARELPWRGADSYGVWVSEIMLQQTRVEAVKNYYTRFMAALPDVYALAAVQEDALYKLWEGLGYYSRARNLKKAAAVVVSQYNGKLPADHQALLQLPGIGPYTAGAIASIAYDIPVPAVDGNVLRVLARILDDDSDISLPATQKLARERVAGILPARGAGTLNQALMELGAVVCLPNGAPDCGHCPVRHICKGRYRAASLPVKAKKAPRRVEYKTVFVLRQDGALIVRKRGQSGLLAGLYEFPNVPGTLTPAQAAAQLAQWGAIPTGEIASRQVKHVFTHIEWHMRVYELPVQLAALPEDWRITAQHGAKALPTAFRICLLDA